MAKISDLLPNIPIEPEAVHMADRLLLTALIRRLVKNEVLTLQDVDSIFGSAIRHAGEGERPSAPDEPDTIEEQAAMLLGYARASVRSELQIKD